MKKEREMKKKKNMSTIFDSQCGKEDEKTRRERERERESKIETRENTERLRGRSKIKSWGERGSNSRPQDFS
jgi:hypothetical protein